LNLTGQVISWLSTIVVVRFLLPHDYGLYSMLEAPLELLLLFSVLGLDVALVQVKVIQEAAIKAAFGFLLLIGFILFSMFFFGAGFLSDYYKQESLAAPASALAFIFLILPFRVIPNAVMDRNLQFKSRAQLELSSKITSAVVTLVLAVNGAGVWALTIGVLVDRVLYAVLVGIRHPWFVIPSMNLSAARSLVAFGGLNAGAGVVQLITSKGVSMIAAPMLGAAQLGIYAFATQFALMPIAKAMPIFNNMLIPAFAQFSERPESAAQKLEQSIRLASIILTPIMIGLAVLSEPFVRLVFGTLWSDVAFPLALMCCIMPLRLCTLFVRSVITSFGRADLLLLSVLFPFLIILPLSYFIAPYGTVYLILLWVVLEPITLLVTMKLANRVLPFSLGSLGRSIRPATLGAVGMAACVYASDLIYHFDAALIRLIMGSLIGALVYIGILFIFFRTALVKTYSVITGR
jgi:O-antigen/teichoic acid export membrane protein